MTWLRLYNFYDKSYHDTNIDAEIERQTDINLAFILLALTGTLSWIDTI